MPSKKHTALHFAQWYYGYGTGDNVATLLQSWLEYCDIPGNDLASFAEKANSDPRWTLMPFFLCTANGHRQSMLQIFGYFKNTTIGIVDFDITKNCDEIEGVAIQEQERIFTLSNEEITAIVNSVLILRDRFDSNIFRFTFDALKHVSKNTPIWFNGKLEEQVAKDKIINARSIFSAEPSKLTV